MVGVAAGGVRRGGKRRGADEWHKLAKLYVLLILLMHAYIFLFLNHQQPIVDLFPLPLDVLHVEDPRA